MDKEKHAVGMKNLIIAGMLIDMALLGVAIAFLPLLHAWTFLFCLICAHWIGSVLILIRRFSKLSKTDLYFIRFGSFFLLIVAIPIAIIFYTYGRWIYFNVDFLSPLILKMVKLLSHLFHMTS